MKITITAMGQANSPKVSIETNYGTMGSKELMNLVNQVMRGRVRDTQKRDAILSEAIKRGFVTEEVTPAAETAALP